MPGIVGFARAAELCLAELSDEAQRQAGLRDRLFAGLQDELEGVTLNGPSLALPGLRLTNNLNVSFAFVSGEALLMNMKDVAVSSGSACTSANPEPSHVLRALGLGDDATRSSLRFGLGRFNTADEIERNRLGRSSRPSAAEAGQRGLTGPRRRAAFRWRNSADCLHFLPLIGDNARGRNYRVQTRASWTATGTAVSQRRRSGGYANLRRRHSLGFYDSAAQKALALARRGDALHLASRGADGNRNGCPSEGVSHVTAFA